MVQVPYSIHGFMVQRDMCDIRVMVVSPLRFTFSLSVSTIPRAGRVGAQRLRELPGFTPTNTPQTHGVRRRGTPAAFAHIGKALKPSIRTAIFRRQVYSCAAAQFYSGATAPFYSRTPRGRQRRERLAYFNASPTRTSEKSSSCVAPSEALLRLPLF